MVTIVDFGAFLGHQLKSTMAKELRWLTFENYIQFVLHASLSHRMCTVNSSFFLFDMKTSKGGYHQIIISSGLEAVLSMLLKDNEGSTEMYLKTSFLLSLSLFLSLSLSLSLIPHLHIRIAKEKPGMAHDTELQAFIVP